MTLKNLIEKKDYILSIALIVMVVLFYTQCEQNESLKEENTLHINSDAELKEYKNKEGLYVSQIAILTTEREKDFLKFKSKDSTILKLQEAVEEYKGKLRSVTIHSGTTSSSGGSITVISKTDTIRKDSLIYLYPTYESKWSNKWEIGSIKATKDSVFRDIKINNEYEITIGNVKNGMFKKKTSEVIVKNLNPNTQTTELKTYEVAQKDKRINLGLQAGYGIGLTTMRPTPYIGVGISFNLIGIK
jgi:hypothetical protein